MYAENVEKVIKIGNIYGFSGGNFAGNVYDTNGLSPTLHRATGGGTTPIMEIKKLQNIGTKVPKKLRKLRRLTTLEAWRLMSFEDTDYYKAKFGSDFPYELLLKKQKRVCSRDEWKILYRYLRKPIMSDTQLYSQAGNSICVNVLVAIFGQLFEGHENDYVRLYYDKYKR